LVFILKLGLNIIFIKMANYALYSNPIIKYEYFPIKKTTSMKKAGFFLSSIFLFSGVSEPGRECPDCMYRIFLAPQASPAATNTAIMVAIHALNDSLFLFPL